VEAIQQQLKDEAEAARIKVEEQREEMRIRREEMQRQRMMMRVHPMIRVARMMIVVVMMMMMKMIHMRKAATTTRRMTTAVPMVTEFLCPHHLPTATSGLRRLMKKTSCKDESTKTRCVAHFGSINFGLNDAIFVVLSIIHLIRPYFADNNLI